MMALEIELKAALSGADAARIEQVLDARCGQGARTGQLIARYFDSADDRLAAHRIALRIRSEDGVLVQTVKAGRRTLGGFHEATEVDATASGWTVDLAAIPDAAIRAQVTVALDGAALVSRFETHVVRRRWNVQHDHGIVEVALDRGDVRVGADSDPILELEFELLEGSPEAVFELAAELLGGVPALLALPSKAARGQALAVGKAWRPVVAGGKPVAAQPGEDGAESWGRALATLAPTIGTNLFLLAEREDVEGPHQLRVALRRLRSAIKLHQPLMDRPLARSLSDTARDIGRIVGPLRDFDVMSETLGLTEVLKDQRRALRDVVIRQLKDSNATAFAIQLLGLATIGGWKRPDRERSWSMDDLSARAFVRLWTDASALGDRLSTLEDVDQHELRKLLKKIRYIIEFSSKTPESKKFTYQLKKLQEELGFLNDILTLSGWSPDLADGLMAQFETARSEREKVMLQRSDMALGRACRYWRALRKLAPPSQPHRAP